MKYQTLKQQVLGHNCRRCINKEFHLNLVPEDCIYMEYRYECKSCKQQIGRASCRERVCLYV